MNELLLAILLSTQPTADDRCIQRAVFYEARGESFRARVAVRDIIRNRARASGKKACQVVYEKGQFSWTAKKHKKRVGRNYKKLLRAKPVLGKRYTHFYNPSVASPSWGKKFKCKKLDRQNFCRVD